MNKFFKVTFSIFGILFVVGVLTIAGVFYFCKWSPNAKGNPNSGSFSQKYETDISAVAVNMTYGDLEFVPSDSWNIEFKDIDISKVNIYVDENQALNICLTSSNDANFLGWDIGAFLNYELSQNSTVIVYYPSGMEFDYVNIQMGIGSVKLNSLQSKVLLCQTVMGPVSFSNCKITNDTVIQQIAGYVKTENTTLNRLNISLSAGICRILNTDSSGIQVENNISFGKIFYK